LSRRGNSILIHSKFTISPEPPFHPVNDRCTDHAGFRIVDGLGYLWREIVVGALDFIQFALQTRKNVSDNLHQDLTGGMVADPPICRKTTNSSKTRNSLQKLGF
jgi:hypothetical protein